MVAVVLSAPQFSTSWSQLNHACDLDGESSGGGCDHEFRIDWCGRLRRPQAHAGDPRHRQHAARRQPIRTIALADSTASFPTLTSSPRSSASTAFWKSAAAVRRKTAFNTSASARPITCTTPTCDSRCASKAHAICEKPLVISPWNLDALEELEEEHGTTRLQRAATAADSHAAGAQARARRADRPSNGPTSACPTSLAAVAGTTCPGKDRRRNRAASR